MSFSTKKWAEEFERQAEHDCASPGLLRLGIASINLQLGLLDGMSADEARLLRLSHRLMDDAVTDYLESLEPPAPEGPTAGPGSDAAPAVQEETAADNGCPDPECAFHHAATTDQLCEQCQALVADEKAAETPPAKPAGTGGVLGANSPRFQGKTK